MKKIFIDFETYFDTKSGFTLSKMSMTEYIRDPRFKVLGCGYLYEGEYGWVRGEDMDSFKELPWHELEMIAHNIKFDGAIFKWKYMVSPARYFDTESLSRAVIGQNLSSHSLKSVAAYLGLPPKGELKTDGLMELSSVRLQEMMEYNKRDLECCAGIESKLRSQFPVNQESAMDSTIRMFVNPVLEIDVPVLVDMVKQNKMKQDDIFKHIGIDKEVFSSNKKFAALLEERHVQVPTKPSPRIPGKLVPAFSLGDPQFVALKATHQDLYEARVAAKSTIVETRGSKLAAIGLSGPFPFDVRFSGAIGTHRYSGGNGAGGNPQNFPVKGDIRRAIKAPDGHMLVVGDFSAIEARIVSWLAKERQLMTAFVAGEDVYSTFASTVYGRTITKENVNERKLGKTCILGLGYNMGTTKFQTKVKHETGIVLSDDESSRVVHLYRDTYANIVLLWQNASDLMPQMVDGRNEFVPFAPFLKVCKNGIVLPSGLKIQYPNLRHIPADNRWGYEWVYDVYKKKYQAEPVKLYGGKLVENICQALAGEICKIAIQKAEVSRCTVVGQVHDEIICVAKEDSAGSSRLLLRSAMEIPVEWWPDLKLSAEVHSGKNWQEAKS